MAHAGSQTAEAGSGSRRLQGYLEAGGSSAVLGSIGALVSLSTMPTGLLLVSRMVVGGAALAPVMHRRRAWGELTRRDVRLPLLAVGALIAVELIVFFTAVRLAGVAIPIFLAYMAPLYVAVAAPILFRQTVDRVVYAALALGLAGMALVVLPGVTVSASPETIAGVALGILAGILFAADLLVIKRLKGRAASTTIVFVQCVVTVLIMLPVAVAQTWGAGYALTSTDVWAVLFLGLVDTAVCATVFTHGVQTVRVEHASILGYVEPLTAPLFAFALLGERPGLTTIAGGCFIVAAGVLVVALGRGEAEPYL
ncbi:MAG TPA: DMT family transporter [Thermoleophilia bacterium]|nr:DMT family transporter [Thermoleophilia bacterium]